MKRGLERVLKQLSHCEPVHEKNKPEFVESSGHGQQDDARIIGFFYVGKKFNLRSTIFSVNVEEFVLDCRCKTLIKVAKPLTPNHSDKV